ncbi:Ca-activated chloride channel family protein [Salipiger thiooxidans]|uniref:Ca-activated chloride channel family protein n=1 Tax=Salipiger thiooxidans TaxID=282683 RepID=A0A1G7FQP1_9RHOB|nr:VWA domain-containing protein [Salipiger thiooxidans]SDE78152.1 Ca-activated chloride channel family protein [Salipiger thiooxidans]
MSFAVPWVFCLLPLPLLLLRLLPARAAASGALTLPPALAMAFHPTAANPVHRHARLIALACAWVALVVALTGPRQEQVLDVVPASGRDIVLALDLSGSMEREDFVLDGRTVSRLAAVQDVAAQFVRGRTGDRVGLVVFGDRAYVAAAPTHDVGAVAQVIGTLQIGVSGKATAIADGLGLAIRRLRGREAESRVIILLSDGQDTTGAVDPVAAAQAAQELGMRVYTIALGPADLASSPDARDAVDSETLSRIAEAAGGETFRVRSTEDLEAVTRAMDRLEPSLADMPPVRTWRLYWPWCAALAVAALAAALVLHLRETA